MQLFIPEIGTRIRLTDDWTFDLHREHRNAGASFLAGWDPPKGYSFSWAYDEGEPKVAKVTIPKGCILTVDRIYIRKGASDFSSVTFFLRKSKDKAENPFGQGCRFWAKLADVNNIKFDEAESLVWWDGLQEKLLETGKAKFNLEKKAGPHKGGTLLEVEALKLHSDFSNLPPDAKLLVVKEGVQCWMAEPWGKAETFKATQSNTWRRSEVWLIDCQKVGSKHYRALYVEAGDVVGVARAASR